MNTLNNNFKDPTWGWARTRSNPTWGCHRQSSLLPRPKRQVALGSAPRIRAAQTPHGVGTFIANRAFCQDPSVK